MPDKHLRKNSRMNGEARRLRDFTARGKGSFKTDYQLFEQAE